MTYDDQHTTCVSAQHVAETDFFTEQVSDELLESIGGRCELGTHQGGGCCGSSTGDSCSY